jgi:hypothetical protein
MKSSGCGGDSRAKAVDYMITAAAAAAQEHLDYLRAVLLVYSFSSTSRMRVVK